MDDAGQLANPHGLDADDLSLVDPADSLAVAVRNYTLFRYMLGCNAYSKWPTKFNGGLFTFDPVWVNPDMAFTPDFRRWEVVRIRRRISGLSTGLCLRTVTLI